MSSMDTMRRLATLWAWLPTFRAVAELEHLRGAALRMRTTPSAIERTLELLEEQLGQRLFERKGARAHLTPLGREVFTALAWAMTT
jgi:DNA-binding transcriptional LysR family regulator